MRRLPVLALLLLAAAALPAADRDLVEVLEQLGATCEWDPLREAGVILARSDRIAFQVGTPFVLVNYAERLDIPAPRREDGRILFAEEAIAAVSAVVARMRREGPAEGLRIGAIVLDPGHGGIDPGGVGTHVVGGKEVPLYEKDIVLPLTLAVGERLRAVFPGKQVVFTRTDDTKIPLEDRSAMANALQEQIGDAVLYVAVHANANPRTKARGFDVWYLPPTFRRTLLAPEDTGDDPALSKIVNSMLEEEISVESVILAREISQALEARIGDRSPNNGLKEEAWAVVRNSRMPAVLVEIGFVTNPAEAELLSDPSYLQDIAEGLYNGIIAFIARFERTGSSGDR
jgi:N-acetylmuramoyl-L-alanine amidase